MGFFVFRNALGAKKKRFDLGPDAKFTLGDVITSKDSFGAFYVGMFEGSGRFDVDYTYDEIALILQGELELINKETGEKKTLTKGDVFLMNKGSKTTFNSPKGYKELFITHPSL